MLCGILAPDEGWLRFDLTGRERDRVDALSKGNQQKVQLIAALLHEPALAILDEPFSGFDPVNQDLVSRLIRELRDAGTTVILSAHHMDLVESIADRVLLLHRGREVMGGTSAAPARPDAAAALAPARFVARETAAALLGFGLWFTVFAAIAATASDPTASSRGQVLFLPGLALAAGFLGDPGNADGSLFRFLALFPFTSPSALPVRMLPTSVAAWGVLAALALLGGSVLLARSAAAKVFALGIHMTGKEPSLAETWHWVRHRGGARASSGPGPTRAP